MSRKALALLFLASTLFALGMLGTSITAASAPGSEAAAEDDRAQLQVATATDPVLSELVARVEADGLAMADYGVVDRSAYAVASVDGPVYQMVVPGDPKQGPYAEHVIRRTAALMKAEGKDIPAVETLTYDDEGRLLGAMTAVTPEMTDISFGRDIIALADARRLVEKSVAAALGSSPAAGMEEAWKGVCGRVSVKLGLTEAADGSRSLSVKAAFPKDVTDEQMTLVGLALDPVVRVLNENCGTGICVETLTFVRGSQKVLEEIRDHQFGQTTGQRWSSYTPGWLSMPLPADADQGVKTDLVGANGSLEPAAE